MDSVTALRHATVAISASGIVVWLCWMRANRKQRLYAIAPLSWLIHSFVFVLARELALPISAQALNVWSASIRLHGIILLIGAALISMATHND